MDWFRLFRILVVIAGAVAVVWFMPGNWVTG